MGKLFLTATDSKSRAPYHVATGKYETCKQCSKGFKSRVHLTTHFLLHHQDRDLSITSFEYLQDVSVILNHFLDTAKA